MPLNCSLFHLSPPLPLSNPVLHLCFFPALEQLLLCDVWCLLHIATWGQGFCLCVHCYIHCALNGVWHKVRLHISCSWNELMTEWTQKLRRVEKGILGWGNAVEKSQRWDSEKTITGYWDMGLRQESHTLPPYSGRPWRLSWRFDTHSEDRVRLLKGFEWQWGFR